MFWNILAKEVQMPEGEGPACGGPVVELEWGWTAGMSEEEAGRCAADAPTGKDSVLTTLDMARGLRDRLSEIIARHEA